MEREDLLAPLDLLDLEYVHLIHSIHIDQDHMC